MMHVARHPSTGQSNNQKLMNRNVHVLHHRNAKYISHNQNTKRPSSQNCIVTRVPFMQMCATWFSSSTSSTVMSTYCSFPLGCTRAAPRESTCGQVPSLALPPPAEVELSATPLRSPLYPPTRASPTSSFRSIKRPQFKKRKKENQRATLPGVHSAHLCR